jgi:hypothetical protein
MNSRNSISFKISVLSVLMIFFLCFNCHLQSQDMKYDPKGNPERWNVNITPFFILPWVSGNFQSETGSGRAYGMTSITYGITLGARFYIPNRGKYPSIF